MKKFRSLFLLSVVAVALSGCTLSVGAPKVDESVTGGIFKTVDQGVSWQQLGRIPVIGGKDFNLFNINTSVLKADPSDPKAFYMGSFADGIFYSYDSGGSWQIMRSLGQKAIIDLAVDPKNKCNIYVATVGRIFKTVDCGRTWQETYSDNVKTLNIYAVVVDHFNSNIIYIGNARGDFMKSDDAGKSWRTLKNFGGEIEKIVMDPKNSRLMLVATHSKGLHRTRDGGATWEDLTPRLQQVKADKGYRDLVASPSTPGFYLMAVDYGLFKTANYGDDWTEIKLIPPERKSYINALAVDNFSNKIIYYDTDTTFYATIDGGVNWSSRKLPTPRKGSKILVSPVKDAAVYIGTKIQ